MERSAVFSNLPMRKPSLILAWAETLYVGTLNTGQKQRKLLKSLLLSDVCGDLAKAVSQTFKAESKNAFFQITVFLDFQGGRLAFQLSCKNRPTDRYR